MLFHKKQKVDNEMPPIDEVQKMTRKGMSDKDIIKTLKSKGYSYEAIESAMLKAVKDSVEEPKRDERIETEAPATDSVFNFMPTMQEQPSQQVDFPDETEAPEVMLEELIEGIVDDKWRKFDDQLSKMSGNFDKIRAEIKQFEVKLDNTKRDSPARELESKMADISEQLEDLEARVGGLEKAFKQFLPSLTRNIESLSQMIHEMKDRQVHEEEM